ncbi:uncharacterized protein LOC132456037 isoform X1 [Gadus macrocephalus]|uniref:uncharacterized protein LOC132456037 isoform X1 n=2 Tax=Gadus macrocephalus TaxID=80720 RepID=UPI0028CB9A1A|nr:uncharacterized protein LOC132456037 isoform X1 [Gadus macrocephalus]
MDDKLIMSVFNFPELYNVTLPTYRCTETRINAWRSISTLMGVPSEECKRRWKNMRDRYLKEVRTELKSKQQGELVPSRWKYRQRLNFLAPFTGTRNGISENFINNNGEDHSPPDLDTLAADSPMSPAPTRRTRAIAKAPATQPESQSQAAFATPSSSPESQNNQWGTLGATGKKRKDLAKETLGSADGVAPSKKSVGRTQDEDELFLLSFVPTLKRLAPQKRCETKMKIQQILYEAEFSLPEPAPKRESIK